MHFVAARRARKLMDRAFWRSHAAVPRSMRVSAWCVRRGPIHKPPKVHVRGANRAPARVNYNIQVLRAVAAFSVLLFHAAPFLGQLGGHTGPLGRIVGVGYVGVDLFFVISGFIVSRGFSQLPASPRQVLRFFERRGYRIFLGYWPVLGLACLYYANQMPERLARVDWPATILLLSHRIPDHVIGQAWSLSFEMFFYLACGLLALTRGHAWRWIVLAYAIMIVALNLRDPAIAKGFFANPHMLELFGGMLLGRVKIDVAWHRHVPWLAAAAMALFGGWLALPSQTRLVTVSLVGMCALLLVLIAELRHLAAGSRRSLMAALGDSSYSLYLLHYLLLEAFAKHAASWGLGQAVQPWAFAVWVPCVVALSHGYYRWAERPIYRRVCAWRGLSARG